MTIYIIVTQILSFNSNPLDFFQIVLKITKAVDIIKKYETGLVLDVETDIDFHLLSDETLNVLQSFIDGTWFEGPNPNESLCDLFQNLKIASPIPDEVPLHNDDIYLNWLTEFMLLAIHDNGNTTTTEDAIIDCMSANDPSGRDADLNASIQWTSEDGAVGGDTSVSNAIRDLLHEYGFNDQIDWSREYELLFGASGENFEEILATNDDQIDWSREYQLLFGTAALSVADNAPADAGQQITRGIDATENFDADAINEQHKNEARRKLNFD